MHVVCGIRLLSNHGANAQGNWHNHIAEGRTRAAQDESMRYTTYRVDGGFPCVKMSREKKIVGTQGTTYVLLIGLELFKIRQGHLQVPPMYLFIPTQFWGLRI